MRRVALALLASVLLLGGCDDPDIASSPGTTTSTSQDETTSSTHDAATSSTVAPDTPGSTIDTDFATPGDERFCGLARSYIEPFARRAAPGDVRGFGEALQESQAIVQQMEEVAPPEIVDDILRLSDVLGAVVPALEAANFDLSQVPPEVLQRLQDPDFQASAQRLQAYVETVCEPV